MEFVFFRIFCPWFQRWGLLASKKNSLSGGKYMKSRQRLFSIRGVSPPSLSRRNCWSEWSQESTHHREIKTPPARGRRITAIWMNLPRIWIFLVLTRSLTPLLEDQSSDSNPDFNLETASHAGFFQLLIWFQEDWVCSEQFCILTKSGSLPASISVPFISVKVKCPREIDMIGNVPAKCRVLQYTVWN